MELKVFFQIQNFLILSLFCYGIYIRRNRKLHVGTMLTAIIWDLMLVLQIELNRGAINKAMEATFSNKLLLIIHVSFAILSVLSYFAVIYFGVKVLKNQNQYRVMHKKIALGSFCLRVMTFITSFLAV